MKSAIITSTIVVASCALLTSAAPAGNPDSNLVARGGVASKIAKPLEKWVLNPQSMTDRDQRKKNRDNAIKIATGTNTGGGARTRHPELQKAMDAAKFKGIPGKKKRAFDEIESELVTRASKAGGIGKAIGKAAEKFILNPQSMTDRDQRKKNRDNAITLATGGNTGGGARTRHPEFQKAMDAAKYKGTKKRALEEEVEAREFDEEFEARAFDDFEDDLFAREFYDLDELD
ncbi:hypothetical protein BDQ12DRAFT_685459 [Crucibulum laeve]|uniref:Uncharacterized protein n=1 Tax=Crucibulum laeve TaxID=68775 RepID=A0A5C3LVM4_9AGAR|nr:hypothetical protein BDQ12DRAFT_685459 [Crucibulum laeve]